MEEKHNVEERKKMIKFTMYKSSKLYKIEEFEEEVSRNWKICSYLFTT